MLMITLYAKQKKRHRYIEQSFRLCGRGEGGMFQENSIKTCILSWVKRSPAQVGCMRQALGPGALERPRGIGWRGGIRMGNTCKPMANSCQCMTETTTIL